MEWEEVKGIEWAAVGEKDGRKRQRESRSEWHMAFSLKKDEQHETKTRIWIS